MQQQAMGDIVPHVSNCKLDDRKIFNTIATLFSTASLIVS